MKSNFFICFVGIDGSGKSTLSRNLVKNLECRGIKVDYVWNRYTPVLMKIPMAIANKILFKKNEIFTDYNSYLTKKRSVFNNSFSPKIYENLLMFDYFLQMIVKVRIPLMLGKNIVCDRYLFDTIVSDLAVDLKYSESKAVSFLNRYLSVSSNPDLTFLIDAPEDIAFRRKTDTPSIEYLKERRKICLYLGKYYKMTLIDGTKKIDELDVEILEIVQNMIKRKIHE